MLKSKRKLAQVEGFPEIRKYLLTGASYADLVAAGGLFPLVDCGILSTKMSPIRLTFLASIN